MKKFRFWIVILSILLSLLIYGTALAADPGSAPSDLTQQEDGAGQGTVIDGAGIEGVSNQYEFTSSTGTYTEIVSGTVYGTASNDDTSFPAIDLGFTFRYNGVDYTQVSIQSNGWIAMGPTITSSYYPLSTGTNNNVISALGRDLQGNGTTSELMSTTEGTAPDRVFTVQWKHYKRYGSSYVGDDFNFQIKLYETSGVLKVVYGPFTVLYVASPPYGPQVGIRGNSNADFNNRTLDISQNWSASIPGVTNADSMNLTDLIYPASGLTYDWSLVTGLFLDPEVMSASGCAGSDVVYQINIINQTGSAQVVNLSYINVWPVTGPASTGTIPNNGS